MKDKPSLLWIHLCVRSYQILAANTKWHSWKDTAILKQLFLFGWTYPWAMVTAVIMMQIASMFAVFPKIESITTLYSE